MDAAKAIAEARGQAMMIKRLRAIEDGITDLIVLGGERAKMRTSTLAEATDMRQRAEAAHTTFVGAHRIEVGEDRITPTGNIIDAPTTMIISEGHRQCPGRVRMDIDRDKDQVVIRCNLCTMRRVAPVVFAGNHQRALEDYIELAKAAEISTLIRAAHKRRETFAWVYFDSDGSQWPLPPTGLVDGFAFGPEADGLQADNLAWAAITIATGVPEKAYSHARAFAVEILWQDRGHALAVPVSFIRDWVERREREAASNGK